MSFYDKVRRQKFLSFTLILFTLSIGIVIGTLVQTGAKAAKEQAAAPDATPLVDSRAGADRERIHQDRQDAGTLGREHFKRVHSPSRRTAQQRRPHPRRRQQQPGRRWRRRQRPGEAMAVCRISSTASSAAVAAAVLSAEPEDQTQRAVSAPASWWIATATSSPIITSSRRPPGSK